MEVVEGDVEVGEVTPLLGAETRAISASGETPSCRAFSMIGVPCASLAHTYRQSWPRMRWKRTQISVCTYSTMWPRWGAPFA